MAEKQYDTQDGIDVRTREDGTYSPLDIDQNGVVDALTDGLLVLRYLFGLEGDQVTIGALADDATRTAEEVQEYLEWVKAHDESELFKAYSNTIAFNFDNNRLTFFNKEGNPIIRAYKTTN